MARHQPSRYVPEKDLMFYIGIGLALVGMYVFLSNLPVTFFL